MIKKTALLLFSLLSISILLASCGGSSSQSDSSPEDVANSAYTALANNDWAGVCSYTSGNAQNVIIEQVNTQQKQFSKLLKSQDVEKIGKNPDCAEALSWLNKATEKLSGQSLSDNIPVVVEGSAKITGDKAVVTTEYTTIGSEQKNEDTVQLIKEEGQWKINE
jgi:hypothetical protein